MDDKLFHIQGDELDIDSILSHCDQDGRDDGSPVVVGEPRRKSSFIENISNMLKNIL